MKTLFVMIFLVILGSCMHDAWSDVYFEFNYRSSTLLLRSFPCSTDGYDSCTDLPALPGWDVALYKDSSTGPVGYYLADYVAPLDYRSYVWNSICFVGLGQVDVYVSGLWMHEAMITGAGPGWQLHNGKNSVAASPSMQLAVTYVTPEPSAFMVVIFMALFALVREVIK